MDSPGSPRVSRRRFLKWAAASPLLGGAAALGYAWGVEPHWVEVVRRELPVARLPSELVGRTLLQISDLHFGPAVDDGYLGRALEFASTLEPDILVITGDFMTCRGPERIDQAARGLGRLRPARLATLAILGNHDYAHNYSQERVADRLTGRLTDLGVTVLRNDVRDVSGLQVAGLDDLWGPNFLPERVLPRLDRDRAALVLCHNPDAADLPVWSGYRGWILSGHTHGGQCRFPIFGTPLIPVKNPRYVRGEVDLEDGRRLYVNRGLGHLLRVRFCVRPEITVFTLTREDAAAS
jgi:predicted MPP superfamily phosphohydrolase